MKDLLIQFADSQDNRSVPLEVEYNSSPATMYVFTGGLSFWVADDPTNWYFPVAPQFMLTFDSQGDDLIGAVAIAVESGIRVDKDDATFELANVRADARFVFFGALGSHPVIVLNGWAYAKNGMFLSLQYQVTVLTRRTKVLGGTMGATYSSVGTKILKTGVPPI